MCLEKYVTKLLSILLILLSQIPVGLADTDETWQLKKQEDGISIYSQPVPGSKFSAFKGVVEIDASSASVMGVLADIDSCQLWIYRCVRAETLEDNGFDYRVFYQVTDLPFPTRDRDAVFEAKVTAENDSRVEINLLSKPNQLPETDYTRVTEGSGWYLLEALGESRVRVTWQQHVEPGGMIPGFLANAMLTDLPFNSLQQLRVIVKEPRYQQLKYKLDANGVPIALVTQ